MNTLVDTYNVYEDTEIFLLIHIHWHTIEE